jgi:multiple sugar transport system permease protein
MGPLIYVNDQRLYPAALGLFGFMAGRENQFTLIMAASVIMTLPVVMVFFLLQRYFIQGVALTGMKG